MDFHDTGTISLISNREDIIGFCKGICKEYVELHVQSELSDMVPTVSCVLQLIDASLFIKPNPKILQYAQINDNLICILPFDVSNEIKEYVENNFKHIVPYPGDIKHFRNFCTKIAEKILREKRNEDNEILENENVDASFFGFFSGQSKLVKIVRQQIKNAALTENPVLILGETGTGKSTAADVIHRLSSRKNHEMVSFSISTLVDTLAASTFFGATKGAFTSADNPQQGILEIADKSTLFLDEFGSLSPEGQAMLLTVLESGNYKKVGSGIEEHVDVRFIFATNADIKKMLEKKTFREDLYYRIDTVIKLPPLREHAEDIPGMVNSFMLSSNKIMTPVAIEKLVNYKWPGNIRQLKKTLAKTVEETKKDTITADLIKFCGYNL